MTQIYCALDSSEFAAVQDVAAATAEYVDGFKLGLEFFTAQGPDGVRRIAALDRPIFLDLKLHDIPNTVAGALRSVMPLAPYYLTLHAAGGAAMLAAAAETARDEASRLGVARPRLLAVTVLTSLDEADLAAQGIAGSAADQVLRLAGIAQQAGCDGVVSSPREVAALRRACGEGFDIVVPGIRPSWAAAGDQKRITTPAQAVQAGADALVIGRPITAAPDPAAAAARIREEIEAS